MSDEPDRGVERRQMVETQLAARGIRDTRVLEAMREVPRHRFVPPEVAAAAYEDRPLPIGEGQTISQPFMVAVMTAALAPGPGDRVLDVGTGSGYQAAVLARLAGRVVTIERHQALADAARERFEALGIDNVTVVVGDGSAGVPAEAPFDGILVAAGAPRLPGPLCAELAMGGRLVIPIGPPGLQRLTIVTRTARGFDEDESERCTFVPLLGQHGWREK